MDHKNIIQLATRESIEACRDIKSPDEWARFGLFIAHKCLREIRIAIKKGKRIDPQRKSDGSPATQLENDIEEMAKDKLFQFSSEVAFMGEELGSSGGGAKALFVIDPIDGTRSFLAGFESYSITIGAMIMRKPLFSLVAMPSSGLVIYRVGDGESKSFAQPFGNSTPVVNTLPQFYFPNNTVLVNVHPSRDALPLIQNLYALWELGKVSLVRSVSGSPSYLISQAAQGSNIYINNWSSGETLPFDLIPAFHILRGSGGVVLDFNGDEIDYKNHSSGFVAGLDKKVMVELIKALKG